MSTIFRVLFLAFAVLCLGVSADAATAPDPSVVGRWSSVPNLPFYPIHVNVLPTGGVMIWPGNGVSGNDPRLWEPATNAVTLLAMPGYDPFCSGHSFLEDGRLFVAGGHIATYVGLPNASIYNPFTDTWTAVPDMNAGRWYPTNTTLPNGDVLVIAGSIDNTVGMNPLPQVFQMQTGTWRNLTNAQLTLDMYPRMHLAPNGMVFNSSPSTITRYLDTSGTGAWTQVANQSYYRESGSSVLYDNGKILIIGGGDPPTNTAEVIDLNSASPAWRSVAPMAFARRHLNATLLPDGKVLATGGTSGPGFDNATTPVYGAEMWDPVTETWSTTASATVPRLYHSAAALLPDGRVLSTGGNNHLEAEVYEPPYLFKGSRPTISSVPASVIYGDIFFVQTPDAANITQVTFLRLSSVTHSFNMDQRISRLSFSQATGGLNVVAPSSANLVPPGYYLLFILNGAEAPSVGRMVRIDTASNTLAPVPTLASLSPNSVFAGGALFTLTVNGSNFVVDSEVRWNGVARTTTFVSGAQLTAIIPAGDIAVAGTASVTVTNPAPGGGTSNALPFTVKPAVAGLIAAHGFEEGSGTSAADSSGNNHTGTLVNGPTWTTGVYGSAVSFDGVDDYVLIANPGSFDFGTADFTMMAWVKRKVTGSSHIILSKTADTAWENGGKRFYIDSGGPLAFDAWGVAHFLSNKTINDLNWHHLAVTFVDSSNVMSLYIDGVLDKSGTLNLGPDVGGHVIKIGRFPDGEFLNGNIDEVRIYSRALGQAEIQNNMNTPIGGAGPDTTPPDTSITSAPSNPSNSSSASFSFTSTEAGGSFQCRLFDVGGLDTSTFAACTSPRSYTGLGNGSHTFQVRAIDLTGNVDPTPASYTWTVDITSPTVNITSPTTTPTYNTTISPIALGGTAADNNAVTQVTWSNDRGGSGTASGTASWTASGIVLLSGTNVLTVTARDAAGNIGTGTLTVTYTPPPPPPDTTPPDTTITAAPSNPSSSSSPSFSFTSTEAGSFECQLDGSGFAACASPGGYSNLANGSHTFQVRAIDLAGNVDPTPASYAWTIDTTVVAVGLVAAYGFDEGSGTSAADSSGNNHTGTLVNGPTWTTGKYGSALSFDGINDYVNVPSFNSSIYTESLWFNAPTQINGNTAKSILTAFDDNGANICFGDCTSLFSGEVFTIQKDPGGLRTIVSGIVINPGWHHLAVAFDSSLNRYRIYLDGVEQSVVAAGNGHAGLVTSTFLEIGTWAIDHDPTSFFKGSIDEIRVYTRALTQAEIQSIIYSPIGGAGSGPTPPDTSITSAPSNPSKISSASFSFTSPDAGSTFQCSLDGAGFVGCASPQSYSNLATGSHTFQVRAIDLAGNFDPTPASYTWTYTPVTRFPDGTTIETGTLGSGAAASLNADDNNYYQVNSTTSGTRTTSWYGIFNSVAKNLSNLKISYKGKNSASCTQTVAIWRWTDNTWQQLDSRAVSTSEINIANLVPPGTLSDYVSGATASGDLRVQVRCTRTGNFTASGDLMKIDYDTP